MSTRTAATDDVARWLLDEHKRVEELIAHLKELTTEPTGSRQRWLNLLKKTFAQFHKRLRKHFTLEEDGGYLDAVTERRPTLSPRVAELENEHRQLEPLMAGIEQLLGRTTIDDRLLITHLLGCINSVIGYIKDHEQKENAMVSETWSTDMGAAD